MPRDEEIAELRDELARARRQLARKNEKIRELRRRTAQNQQGRRLAPLPYPETPVFFLVGRGRSGTTWLQEVLNAHPEVLCRGEGYLFDRNFRWDDFKDLHPRLKPASLYNAIAENEHLRLWVERSVWGAGKGTEEHLDNLTRIAVNYFLGRKLARTNARLARVEPETKARKRIVGDKTPFISGKVLYEMNVLREDAVEEARAGDGAVPYNGAGVLEEISRIYPEAKVIHIIRDGRDVAVSVMHFMWGRARGEEGGIYELEPEEIERRDAHREDPASFLASGQSLFTEKRLRVIARGWAAEVVEAVERGPEVLGDRYVEVRYEELLSRPEEELGRVLGFLGADDAGAEAARGALEAAGFGRLSGRGGEREGSAPGRSRKAVAGGWRGVFTERDREVFKEEAGELLVRLGYESGPDW